jgi:hypothetical protein
MAYRIAAVDVHKKMVAVVVADVEVEGEYRFDSSAHATERLRYHCNFKPN